MLYTTKLANAGLTADKFGRTFQKNIISHTKYSETLDILKKQLKQPGADAAKINEEIEVVKAEMDEINKRLCQTIQRYVNNPDLVEKHKARLKEINDKRRSTSSSSSPAATPPAEPDPTPTDTPAPTDNNPAPKPEPTKTATSTAPKPIEKPKPADKKKSSAGTAVVGGIIGLVVGAVVGYSSK